MGVILPNYPIRSECFRDGECCHGDLVVVRAEAMFKEMMDEPLLRMAISRGNHPALLGEGSDISDYHHGDGDSTVDGISLGYRANCTYDVLLGSDPGYNMTNTREIGVIHEIRITKGEHLLGLLCMLL